MGLGLGGKEVCQHVVSFLIGATLTTALLVFLGSDRLGEGLSTISSSWGSTRTQLPALAGTGTPPAQVANNTPAPAAGGAAATHGQESEFAGLAELLPKVATDDGTVIITSVNEAFARPNSLLDLFRESFRASEGIEHLLDHVLVVAVDDMAFAHCTAVHPHCYLLQVQSNMNLSSAKAFMSEAYVELVWTKLSLQQRVLELGYSFLFTDVDIVWLRNPFWHISVFADMTTSSDVFRGDASSLDNLPNTGFYYVRATDRAVEMLRRWRAARARFPPNHEQAIFNEIKGELAGDLGVRIRFLDTARFGGFCQIYHSDMGGACTMHANCCFGLSNKLHDLRDVLGQWRNYTGLTPEEKKTRKFTWKNPAKCGTPDKKDWSIDP